VPRIVFLRRVPRDPFNPDPALAPAQQWATRSYGSPPDDPQPGTDVFDVTTRSSRKGLNGIVYREW
jgi:general secretion pathway protein G